MFAHDAAPAASWVYMRVRSRLVRSSLYGNGLSRVPAPSFSGAQAATQTVAATAALNASNRRRWTPMRAGGRDSTRRSVSFAMRTSRVRKHPLLCRRSISRPYIPAAANAGPCRRCRLNAYRQRKSLLHALTRTMARTPTNRRLADTPAAAARAPAGHTHRFPALAYGQTCNTRPHPATSRPGKRSVHRRLPRQEPTPTRRATTAAAVSAQVFPYSEPSRRFRLRRVRT